MRKNKGDFTINKMPATRSGTKHGVGLHHQRRCARQNGVFAHNKKTPGIRRAPRNEISDWLERIEKDQAWKSSTSYSKKGPSPYNTHNHSYHRAMTRRSSPPNKQIASCLSTMESLEADLISWWSFRHLVEEPKIYQCEHGG
jgi:hypothetical protein